MSNDVKLEPCPFCGSDTAQTRTTRWNPFIDRWTVSCAHGCHADGPSHETEAEAIAAWNARHQSQQRDAVLEEAIAFARSESERAQKAEWSRDRALEENAANQRAKMAVVDMIAAHPKYARGSGGGVRRTDKTTGRIGEYKYTPAWEKVAEFIHGLLVEMGGDADTMWAEYLKAWEKHGCDAALTTPVRPAVSTPNPTPEDTP